MEISPAPHTTHERHLWLTASPAASPGGLLPPVSANGPWRGTTADQGAIRSGTWVCLWLDLDSIAVSAGAPDPVEVVAAWLRQQLLWLSQLQPRPRLVGVSAYHAGDARLAALLHSGPGGLDALVCSTPFHPVKAAAAIPAPPQFDADALLDRLMGNEMLARKVVRVFLADTPRLLLALSQALEEGNHQEASHLAHSIRGSALNAGADSLVAASGHIEALCREGKSPEAIPALPVLEQDFAALKPVLESFAG